MQEIFEQYGSELTFTPKTPTVNAAAGSQTIGEGATVTARAYQKSARASKDRGIANGQRLLTVEGVNFAAAASPLRVDYRVTLDGQQHELGRPIRAQAPAGDGTAQAFIFLLGTGGS